MKGTIVTFDPSRRFGFLRPLGGSDEIFFHVSGVVSGHDSLVPGATVRFQQTIGDNGPQAVNIVVTRGPLVNPYSFFVAAGCGLTALIYVMLVYYAGYPHGYAYLIGINGALFCLCAFDKSSAAFAANRVPEKVMYLYAALGGAFGLMLGMKLFRHKTQKSRFQFFLLGIAIAQIALLSWLRLLAER